jgi:hypothetical protein
MEAEAAGEFTSGEDEWLLWTGAPDVIGMASLPGSPDEPSWWLLYGELPVVGAVRVLAEDGNELPVRVVGKVWACEWRSPRQPVTVEIGARRFVREFMPRRYLGGREAGD